MQNFINKSFFFKAMLAVATCVLVSCGDDAPGDEVVEPAITAFSVVSPVAFSGTVDQTEKTLAFEVPGGADLSSVEIEVEVPAGATVTPASGSVVDLTNPIEFIVTGMNVNGAPVSRVYTAMAIPSASVAFVGKAATMAELEDDAKAAATWAQETYGDEFVYLPAAQINGNTLTNVKVIFYYELSAGAPVSLGGMNAPKTVTAISNFVRRGGQLLLAGDATNYIFNIGRVPAAFGFGENNPAGVETGKAPDDQWGLSVVPGTTSADRTTHPLFEGVINGENRVFLYNAPTREVRLIWWNVGPAGGDCCGNLDMVTNFEEQLQAVKLASLRHVGDYFGFAAVELLPTNANTHANISPSVPKDFKGTILVLANSIIGYEWAPNDGAPNDYQENIERLTKNALDYLIEKYDEIQ
ncbi:DUF4960 domain-containing protein [Cesiribacter andamanensis]|uniref:Putative glycoside hydrolase n=1 Tax=Cesiribacter andamanensis AMV16 TaxID=1279009 RepID=M7NBP4_9BACT|nr:DUF4960 domain-containing protein [Cesiribacter andamanensis]EMR04672.1 Putative glycoside hydrolase [Cesiribacter andamanensis AMV16]